MCLVTQEVDMIFVLGHWQTDPIHVNAEHMVAHRSVVKFPPFSRGNTVVKKKGTSVIRKHFVVQHHLALLPHPWGGLHASATKLRGIPSP